MVRSYFADWSFLLEEEDLETKVWFYQNDEPIKVQTKRGERAFFKTFPTPQNYWEKSVKILAWCKRFSNNRKFQEKELALFKARIEMGL